MFKMVIKWLLERYGKEEAVRIWRKTRKTYNSWLFDLPDYGGKKNGHENAIYSGLLIFALYPALPDQPPIEELQGFVQTLFMEPFTKLGKVFDLNRNGNMWLIDRIFQKEREAAAKERIFSLLPEDQKEELTALFDEFEEWKSPEAKYAHALDNLQPLILNNSNDGGDWVEHGVSAGTVYGRQKKTKLGSEKLYEVTDQIIRENIRKGSLPE